MASLTVLPGWRGASLALAPGLALSVALNARPGGRFVRNLTLYGLVAGFVELAADAWLVEGTGTLLYPPGEPRLWDSPAYMPIAWFGMLGIGFALVLGLSRWLSRPMTLVACATALALYIPLYEAIAAYAGWWRYTGTPSIAGVVPHYILLGEWLLALPLVRAAELLVSASIARAIGLGVAQGLWIGISYYLAFQLVG